MVGVRPYLFIDEVHALKTSREALWLGAVEDRIVLLVAGDHGDIVVLVVPRRCHGR